MEGIFRRRNLPHWYVLGSPVFITGCLHGSISQAGMREIDNYRNTLRRMPRPQSTATDDWEHIQQKRLFAFIDKLLGQHSSICHFDDKRLAEVVANSFLHFAGVRYSLIAFVVMPSHHHWLFTINEDWATKDQVVRAAQGKKKQTPREVISHSIQSFTASACNEILGQKGRFWQQETYDHWVRDDEEMHRIAIYIENNPVAAGLTDKPENYRWSSAFYRLHGMMAEKC